MDGIINQNISDLVLQYIIPGFNKCANNIFDKQAEKP